MGRVEHGGWEAGGVVEAEEHGVELGKHWVNNHLQGMRGSS